ncbi:hypothetical protein U1Q18_009817 [Sarracenia purpurea var. burkii]
MLSGMGVWMTSCVWSLYICGRLLGKCASFFNGKEVGRDFLPPKCLGGSGVAFPTRLWKIVGIYGIQLAFEGGEV